MKKLIFAFFLLIPAYFLQAQVTVNDENVEKRTIPSFHGIEVGTGIELLLTQGNTEELAVSAASPEFRDKIITKVENGILKIHYESKTGAINKKHETKNLRAYVSCKELDRLYATTGSEVKINGLIHAGNLDMKANTGATIHGKVEVVSLKLDQDTGSRVNLSGKSDNVEATGSTGSRFNGEDMQSNTCNIKVNTGARISIHADKELQVKASTGGIVTYKGAAGIREIKTNTGGSVSRI